MASKATEHTSTCLVCYETRPLKIVGNCKHSFCTECLSTVFESLDSGTEVFACPTCKVECPRPWDGVKGLVDFTGKDVRPEQVAVPRLELEKQKKSKARNHPKRGPDVTKDVKCQICLHKKKDVQAVSLCVKCGHFYFCQDCTDTHAQNKATMNHVVTLIRPEKKQDVAVCKTHDTDLTSYCETCGSAVCTVCVMLNHADHTVEDLADMIGSKAKEVQSSLERQEKRLTKLQKDLALLKAQATTVDRQDILIKEIEDHAEKCINQIVKWKEDLKTKIRKDFKVVKDVAEYFEKGSEVGKEIQESINKAAKLLSVTECHSEYLQKLISLQQDLESSANKTPDDTERRVLQINLGALHRSHHSFVPKAMRPTFGKVNTTSDFEHEPKEVFRHTVQVNDRGMFIPCVANLGKKFAVAHPTKEGEFSNAIDIYEFPGTLIKTLRDHVPPIYDMCSTPDGKLAVLSNGTVDSSCSVQLFDPETGYIRSTSDITDVTKPLSLGVTLQNQYVILGDNDQGRKEITVVDKDGLVEHRYLIETDKVMNANRIACGGRFIFLEGRYNVAVYKISTKGLQDVKYENRVTITEYFTDIAATVWDEIILVRNDQGSVGLRRCQDNEHKQEWHFTGHLEILEALTAADREARVSTRDGHIVVAHGQTIRVYKL